MKYLLLIIFGFLVLGLNAQSDADNIKTIYKNALTNGQSYQWLDYLSNEIGGRLSGSLNAELAVAYTKAELENLGLDKRLVAASNGSKVGAWHSRVCLH